MGASKRVLGWMDSILPFGCWASLFLMALVFVIPLIVVLVSKL